jgi:hypothetical protein
MVSYVARTARQVSFFGVTASAFAFSADIPKCLSPIKDEYRDALAKRLDAYLKANHSQNWAELFALVSDAARGGLEREASVARMKAAHRKDFSNSPDLIEFKPDRAAKGDGREYDVYGCGKAHREE